MSGLEYVFICEYECSCCLAQLGQVLCDFGNIRARTRLYKKWNGTLVAANCQTDNMKLIYSFYHTLLLDIIYWLFKLYIAWS